MTKRNIWENIQFSDRKEKSALDFLIEEKDGLYQQTGGELKMEVDSIDSYIDTKPTITPASLYSVFIIAPKLGNFRRKIFTVIEYSQHGRFPVDIHNHLDEADKRLNVIQDRFLEEIASVLTSNSVMTSIQNLYQQSKEHGYSIGLNILSENHAGVLILRDGSSINYGVISVTDENLTIYTGKALRLYAEKKESQIANMTEAEKIDEGYVRIIPLSSILKVLS